MLRASLASLCAIAAVAIATPARAGGFVTAGVGTSHHLGGELGRTLDAGGERSGRIGIGHRVGPVSVEANLRGYGVHGTVPDRGGALDGTAYGVSVSFKVQLPLIFVFDGYGRAGLQRAWVSSDAPNEDLAGTGYLLGLGLELRIPFIPFEAALWAEGSRDVLTLYQGGMSYVGHIDTLMVGLRVGL